MSARFFGGAALALLLAACTPRLTSTLAAAGPPPSRVGAPVVVLAPLAVEAELARVEADLGRRIVGRDWGVPVQLSRAPGAALRVRLGADESFVPASAQLRPTALVLYAELADVLHLAPGLVAHVLVHGDGESDDPATDLTARRAASVLSYFTARGLPGTRLRAEGRGAREPISPDAAVVAPSANRRVELVLRPVVAGRESEAWTPPPPYVCDPCAEPGA